MEPLIIVNGVVLSTAQSMAVRVAVTDFLRQVCDPEVAADLGPIADGYKARLREVQTMMLRSTQ